MSVGKVGRTGLEPVTFSV